MSIHVNLSPEAQQKLKRANNAATVSSLFMAIVFIALVGGALSLMNILIPSDEPEVIISYNISSADATDEPEEKVVNRPQVQPAAASSATAANVMTSIAASEVSIPDTVELTEMESSDFGNMDDFGDGFESMESTQGDFGSDESFTKGKKTLFGGGAQTGLMGYLYDLKQLSNGKESEIGRGNREAPDHIARIRSFRTLFAESDVYKHGYTSESMSKYFKAKNRLDLSYLVIDYCGAKAGPKAFGAEKKVEPSLWLAMYEGVFAKDAERSFRFLGRFDDVLIVYLNDRVVFDGCYNAGYTKSFGKMEMHPNAPHLNGAPGGTRMGPFIHPREGDHLRIVVGEIPGGNMGGGLFIEEKGVENPGMAKDGKYRPIPFCTVPLSDKDKKALRGKKLMEFSTEKVPVFKFRGPSSSKFSSL